MFIGIAGVTWVHAFRRASCWQRRDADTCTSLDHALCHMRVGGWFLAYKDITFSTILMLIFEGVSVTVIMHAGAF